MFEIVRSLKNRVFYGWWIVALGALINAVGTGILYYSFTVFFLPLKRDLGVSSAAISLLYGAARLEGGIEGPVIGHLIDRFGSRRIIMIGGGLAGVGLILLSTVHTFFAFFLLYVLVVSLGSNAGFFHPVTTAVNKWFIRRRGTAFSIISASGSVGGMIMAPLLSYIILDFGWRIGAIFAGLIILIVTLPSAIFIKQSPESMGLHPDGQPFLKDSIQQLNPSRQEVFEVTYTVREALKALQFWLLTAGISLRLLVTIALNTHFVPLLVWKGMSEATSAYMVGAAAFGGIFTSLVLGWLGDRWNKTLLSSLCIVPMILSMVGLIFSKENAVLYLFPISFAITMGTSPLNWALIGDFFGRGSYATIRGIMGVAYGTATFISPIYAGWIFDRTGSYNLVLITFSIILGMSAMFFAVLGRPSPPKQKNKSLALL